MNAGVSFEKEKVKESQSVSHEAWHPRLTPTSGAGSGASQEKHKIPTGEKWGIVSTMVFKPTIGPMSAWTTM